MNKLMDWLAGNPYLNLIFLVLAITSVAVSIFLYFKSKKSKKPTYLTKSFAIIEDNVSAIEGLEVKFKEHEIQRLTISRLSFWNEGSETIDANDIAPTDKLRLKIVENGEIISAKPILEKREANNIAISVEDNEAYINFDFLDYGDGAIFEIYHTGSAEELLIMKGTIKGVSHIKFGEYKKDYVLDKVFDPLFGWADNLNIKEGSFAFYALIAVLMPFAAPIVILLSPIDKAGTFLHRIPKDYDLSGINTPNKTLQPTSQSSATKS